MPSYDEVLEAVHQLEDQGHRASIEKVRALVAARREIWPNISEPSERRRPRPWSGFQPSSRHRRRRSPWTASLTPHGCVACST